MNLATAAPRTIATLIFKGKRQLSEVPGGRRAEVEHEMLLMKRDQLRAENPEMNFEALESLLNEEAPLSDDDGL